MSRWLASSSMVKRMKTKTILELGAGCGIPALTAAVYGTPKSVWITDLNPDTIDNIRHNIELNGCSSNEVTASSIDWGDASTYPSKKLDYVICSDCIYQKDIAPLLHKVITGLLDPNHGVFLYVAPEGGRDGLPEFIAIMKSGGFECVTEEVAPDLYRENPLTSEDEEDCFLHFHELGARVYILYEFQRR
jgi:predicted nicotinamide N-methyase